MEPTSSLNIYLFHICSAYIHVNVAICHDKYTWVGRSYDQRDDLINYDDNFMYHLNSGSPTKLLMIH
jgi:hypothetical protein